MILDCFVFFDTTSATQTSNTYYVLPTCESMALSVTGTGTISLEVQGRVDTETDQWLPIVGGDVSIGAKALKATVAGHVYSYSVSNFREIRIVSDNAVGTFKAFANFS